MIVEKKAKIRTRVVEQKVLSTVRYYATKLPEIFNNSLDRTSLVYRTMPIVHYVVQHVHDLDSKLVKLFQQKLCNSQKPRPSNV